MAGDLYLVGSCPFDTSEEVFRALGPKLGQWLPFIPDGEVGDRTYWINQIAYNVYNGHPDIETIQRLASVAGSGPSRAKHLGQIH